MKNRKALSPIFAVLILIAIAVIAGIVVYMFTSGYLAAMMGQGSAGQEKASLQAVVVDSDLGGFTCHISNTGPSALNITAAVVRDADGKALATVTKTGGQVIAAGEIGGVHFDYTFTQTAYYSVAAVSANGNQFVSGSFKVTL